MARPKNKTKRAQYSGNIDSQLVAKLRGLAKTTNLNQNVLVEISLTRLFAEIDKEGIQVIFLPKE